MNHPSKLKDHRSCILTKWLKLVKINQGSLSRQRECFGSVWETMWGGKSGHISKSSSCISPCRRTHDDSSCICSRWDVITFRKDGTQKEVACSWWKMYGKGGRELWDKVNSKDVMFSLNVRSSTFYLSTYLSISTYLSLYVPNYLPCITYVSIIYCFLIMRE